MQTTTESAAVHVMTSLAFLLPFLIISYVFVICNFFRLDKLIFPGNSGPSRMIVGKLLPYQCCLHYYFLAMPLPPFTPFI